VLPLFDVAVAWPWFALIGAIVTFSTGYAASFFFVRSGS
jgi:hypothetical protein